MKLKFLFAKFHDLSDFPLKYFVFEIKRLFAKIHCLKDFPLKPLFLDGLLTVFLLLEDRGRPSNLVVENVKNMCEKDPEK